jgi:hypothetical protein
MNKYSNKLRFASLIGGSIVVALLLVSASVAMYYSSGAAQVDLSRPGYQAVREQTKSEDSFKGFSSSGDVDQKSLEEFSKLYKERAIDTTTVDAFNSEVLSDAALDIDDTSQQSQ